MIKNQSKKAGFTLVEMITVLIIITLLMSVSSAAIVGAKRNASMTRARDLGRQLCIAWGAYLMDQRSFPAESKFTDKVGGDNYFKASAVNLGKNLNRVYNKKGKIIGKKVYFELSEEECEPSGSSFTGTGLLNDWKWPICFTLDFDLDGKVKTIENQDVNASACAYSQVLKSGKKKVISW